MRWSIFGASENIPIKNLFSNPSGRPLPSPGELFVPFAGSEAPDLDEIAALFYVAPTACAVAAFIVDELTYGIKDVTRRERI